MNPAFQGLLLTTLAGFSTGIGSVIAYFLKEPKKSYLSIFTGFSAGVMIYVSFVELLGSSIAENGFLLANIGFFTGIGVIYVLDKFLPHFHLDNEPDMFHDSIDREKIHNAGLLTAIGIALHNFPEGIAVFVISLESISLAIPIAFAIAIHNVPEGIAVSVPIYYSTGSKRKAFYYSFLSGIAEPLGAIMSLFFLLNYLNTFIIHMILAAVAGIMVFISFDELLPISRQYGGEHTPTIGLFSGMLVMMISLTLF